MAFIEQSISEYSKELSSSAPIPGGGSASALVGSLAASLGLMVANLTINKDRYKDVADDIESALRHLESLRNKLLSLVDEDGYVFEPLAKIYAMPKDDPARKDAMGEALRNATSVPLDTMETAAEMIPHLERLARIGNKTVLSDVGVAAACCEAALKGASLNIFINAQSMEDRTYAEMVTGKANRILQHSATMAADLYKTIKDQLDADHQG